MGRPIGCACRKSNTYIQMMKSAKKWLRKNAKRHVVCAENQILQY
jgi:hypothetical protein